MLGAHQLAVKRVVSQGNNLYNIGPRFAAAARELLVTAANTRRPTIELLRGNTQPLLRHCNCNDLRPLVLNSETSGSTPEAVRIFRGNGLIIRSVSHTYHRLTWRYGYLRLDDPSGGGGKTAPGTRWWLFCTTYGTAATAHRDGDLFQPIDLPKQTSPAID